MHFNIEIYRLKNIFFQRTRQTNQLMMINSKNLNNISKNNTLIILDCLFSKKKIFEKNKIISKTLIILWNNYYKRFSGYLLKSLNLKPFGRFYSNRKFFQLEKFLKSSYIDLECSFFDLFKMFQKNFKISIPVLSLKENIFLKITRIRKAENQIL